MKKAILVILSLVLALGCISSFAVIPPRGYYYGVVGFDKATGVIGESFNNGDIGSDRNEIREDWTASRGMGNAAATFVNIGTETEVNPAVKINSSEFITNDYGPDADLFATVDLKCTTLGEFCGLVIDGNVSGLGSTTTEFGCSHPNTVLYSGYGFNIINKTTLRAFVFGSQTGTPDYYDFDLGFDASVNWHSYSIYKKAEEKVAYVKVDDKLIAVFDFAEDLGANIGIYDKDGNPVAVDTNDGMSDSRCTPGSILFAVVGEATEIYMDNIGYHDGNANVYAFTQRGYSPFEDGATWIGNGLGNTERFVKFNTTNPIVAITFPQYWAGRSAEVVITLKNVYTKEIYTATETFSTDGPNGGKVAFDTEVPAGTYEMTIDLANKGGEGEGGYFVMAGALEYDGDKILYQGGAEFAFGLQFAAPASNYFRPVPAPSPATADANLVIFVLAAAAIALVVLKKKAF